MARKKLNYIFINPNTPEATANYLVKLFIEVNKDKVEKAVVTRLRHERISGQDEAINDENTA